MIAKTTTTIANDATAIKAIITGVSVTEDVVFLFVDVPPV
jgi:hypothetical protein